MLQNGEVTKRRTEQNGEFSFFNYCSQTSSLYLYLYIVNMYFFYQIFYKVYLVKYLFIYIYGYIYIWYLPIFLQSFSKEFSHAHGSVVSR